MTLALPSSLSPSKMSSFKDCGLAFRYNAIDRIEQPPTEWTVKGTVVHRALELLYEERSDERTRSRLLELVVQAGNEHREEIEELEMPVDVSDTFTEDVRCLALNIFKLEDPAKVNPVGNELLVEAGLDSFKLRGIIDRIEINADGGITVIDYKSGKTPSEIYEQKRMQGIYFYAYLCERVFGQKPDAIKLYYLAEPVVVSIEPSQQAVVGLERKARAVWAAIERACATENFKPSKSPLCHYCAYRDRCPLWS